MYKDAKKIREIISEDKINALAKESGWSERDRKFKGMDLVKTMVFMGHGHYQLSLNERCMRLLGFGIKLSKQALDKRLNAKAALFIKTVLEAVLRLKLLAVSRDKWLEKFTSIKIIDATLFELPQYLTPDYKGSGGSASTSGVKTHYQLAIAHTDQMDLAVVDGVSPDTCHSRIDAQKGDLLLFDLGYFSFANLEKVASAQAYYLSRLKYGIQVWIQTPRGFKRLNWHKQLGKMQVGQCLDLTVYLGKEKKVKTRLSMERVPDEIAHQRRRKLNTKMRNKSKALSKARLAFCSVNAFITNTTEEQLPAVELRSIYRLRWQIEIYFKTWKSYMNIDKIERMNIHRFNCTHYGTLLYIILCCKVFLCFKHYTWKKQHKELSELKAMKFLAKHRDWIWDILYLPIEKARDRLETLQDILHTHGIKEPKKGTLTPYQTIEKVLS